LPEPQPTRNIATLFALAAILAAALGLRLAYVFQIVPTNLVEPTDLDPGFYYNWAKEIAAGNWLGTTPFVQSPLYAYLLGIFIKLFGPALTPILVVQSLVGVGTVLLTYVAGRRFFDARHGLVAAAFLAIYGPFVFYEGMVMKTFLSPFLTILLALLLERAQRASTVAESGDPGGSIKWFAASGVLFGLLALDRDNFILMAPVLAFLAYRLGRRAVLAAHEAVEIVSGPVAPETFAEQAAGEPTATMPAAARRAPIDPALRQAATRAGRRAAVALALGTVVVIAPVTLRNWIVSKELVLLTTGGGEVFFIGNNADANGLYVPPPFVRPDPKFEHADFIDRGSEIAGHTLSPMQSSWFWFREGVRFIADSPLQWLSLEGRKLFFFWNWYELPDNLDYAVMQWFSPLLRGLNVVWPPQDWPAPALPAGGGVWMQTRAHLYSTFGLLAPLGLLGMVVSWRRRRELASLYVLLFGYMGTVLLFFNFSRFRVPVVPILALFAAAGIFALGRALVRAARWAQALARRSGALAERGRELLPKRTEWVAVGVFVAGFAVVNLEYPRGVVPAIEQALLIGNAYYGQGEAKKALQSYTTGLILLGEGPQGEAGDALLRAQFGPRVTREAIARELEVESVARGPQFKGIHLGIHHGLGIAMVQQAQDLLDQGHRVEAMPILDAAIAQFDEALRIAPSYLLSHRKLARAYILKGDTPRGVEILRKAVDLWPEDAPARLELAEVLYASGEFRDALRQLDAARHYNAAMSREEEAQLTMNRGLIFMHGLEEPGKALYDFNRALELDPNHPQATAIRQAIQELTMRGTQPLTDAGATASASEPGARPSSEAAPPP
jgi:4-amino-4-deoxy-L-arabinose transferase-like glycosyltransferase/cytochrome c-type biogenesis protein CcmH/NrfG